MWLCGSITFGVCAWRLETAEAKVMRVQSGYGFSALSTDLVSECFYASATR